MAAQESPKNRLMFFGKVYAIHLLIEKRAENYYKNSSKKAYYSPSNFN